MKTIKILSFFFLLLFGISSTAQEAKYKAVFIYNFTKHFEWPVSYRTGDFVIGVVGNPVIINELTSIIKGKTVGNQNIVINRFKDETVITKCHILFIPSNKSKSLSSILSKMGTTPTLIITEKVGLAKQGADINFIIKEGKIKFELNKPNILKRKLKVSSYLETLAIIVN